MKNLNLLLGLVLAALSAACAPHPPAVADAGAALHQLFDQEWSQALAASPVTASFIGDARYNDRWDDLSPAARARRQQQMRAALAAARAIPRAALSAEDQLNDDLFQLQLDDDLQALAFGADLRPVDQRSGLQTANEILDALHFATAKDYQDWISRLQHFGTYTDQTIALMREGMARGRVFPRVIMQRVPAQIAQQLVDDPRQSPFYRPFVQIPAGVGDAAALQQAGEAAIREQVIPSYRRFQQFFIRDYLPACSDSVGLSAQPQGAAFYAYLVRHHTTTTLTPEQIHQLGLAEVARIRGEMETVKTQAGFTGDLPAFFRFLRSDPRFFIRDPNALLDAYVLLGKRIDPELVHLFGKLPRMPYGVRAIPAISAPDTTTAYYAPGAADGSRAGYYYVNLYRPETRPTWEMAALTLHESVPGHHLQLSLQQELGELPEFRRNGDGFTAYVEGWALYAESLGGELGLYTDPYSHFGQLTYEMWRAVRLVVDTGLHAQGWTREQAIAYFRDNTAKSDLDIANEVDRYLAMPGQALAYKIGQMKIQELRARAQARLGERFDIRAFHDAVLGSGAVPLNILEARIDAWIASQSAGH